MKGEAIQYHTDSTVSPPHDSLSNDLPSFPKRNRLFANTVMVFIVFFLRKGLSFLNNLQAILSRSKRSTLIILINAHRNIYFSKVRHGLKFHNLFRIHESIQISKEIP